MRQGGAREVTGLERIMMEGARKVLAPISGKEDLSPRRSAIAGLTPPLASHWTRGPQPAAKKHVTGRMVSGTIALYGIAYACT